MDRRPTATTRQTSSTFSRSSSASSVTACATRGTAVRHTRAVCFTSCFLFLRFLEASSVPASLDFSPLTDRSAVSVKVNQSNPELASSAKRCSSIDPIPLRLERDTRGSQRAAGIGRAWWRRRKNDPSEARNPEKVPDPFVYP